MKKSQHTSKLISLGILFLAASGILISGLIFGVISVIHNTTLPVLGARVPGAVFGAIAAFLGLRYLLSVIKLGRDVLKSESVFSWGNFKRSKAV